MPELNAYYLAKWSAYVRNRDGMVCQMCNDECLSRSQVRKGIAILREKRESGEIDLSTYLDRQRRLKYALGEAHHIWPKAVFPELAYELRNGICLCFSCHRAVVHNKWLLWRQYVQMFTNIAARRRAARDFNAKYQNRVQPKEE